MNPRTFWVRYKEEYARTAFTQTAAKKAAVAAFYSDHVHVDTLRAIAANLRLCGMAAVPYFVIATYINADAHNAEYILAGIEGVIEAAQ